MAFCRKQRGLGPLRRQPLATKKKKKHKFMSVLHFFIGSILQPPPKVAHGQYWCGLGTMQLHNNSYNYRETCTAKEKALYPHKTTCVPHFPQFFYLICNIHL